ncbi:potassium transporter TrkG [Lewinella sp. IMCC34183]|uniref:potassium transporter TrkG n=1 Tax=Lewinella sp. IMCC34183 TaxID=2248762 RepID=UPI0018E50AFA|nr:potassium transporter TrkG [Lewinella sp. IMCC34183]
MKINYTRRARLAYLRFFNSRSPQLNIVLGFLVYTLAGWVLLCLPFLHTQPVGWLDNLFVATSAISTTGLAPVSVADSYNWGGELVVLLLIQAGGIGYMTLTTYYLLLTTRRITRWHENIIGAAFTMPDSIELRDFIRSAIVFTVVMELLGTVGFLISFLQADMGFWQAL